jgi:hypothetical protein
MWWKKFDGDYVNGDKFGFLHAGTPDDSPDPPWIIWAYGNSSELGGQSRHRLAGDYDTQAEAQDAARHLVSGFDPSI